MKEEISHFGRAEKASPEMYKCSASAAHKNPIDLPIWSYPGPCNLHALAGSYFPTTPSTSSITATMKSASASVMHIGGLIRSVLP